jgi:hypothetical protein
MNTEEATTRMLDMIIEYHDAHVALRGEPRCTIQNNRPEAVAVRGDNFRYIKLV